MSNITISEYPSTTFSGDYSAITKLYNSTMGSLDNPLPWIIIVAYQDRTTKLNFSTEVRRDEVYDLFVASGGNTSVGGHEMSGFSSGENVNGKYIAWYDTQGNPVMILQYNPNYDTRVDGATVTFPIAFPDTNYFGWHETTVEHAHSWINKTTTTAQLKNRDSSGAFIATASSWALMWVRGS